MFNKIFYLGGMKKTNKETDFVHSGNRRNWGFTLVMLYDMMT